MDMSKMSLVTRLVVAVLLIASVPAFAADPSSAPGGISLPPGDGNTYGLSGNVAVWLPASAFLAHESTTTWIRTGNGSGATARTSASGNFWAPVNLPAGAVVNRVEIHYFDNSASNTGFMCFTRYNTSSNYNLQETCQFFPAGVPGQAQFGFVPNATISTMDNRNPYVVHIFPEASNPDFFFYGVRIVYKLTVSPAPAVATFGDVSNASPIYRFVEALAASGITGGCGGGNYCPDTPVTRGQMAVFLSAALGLHWSDPATIP